MDPEINARINTPERMSPKPAGRAPTPKLITLPQKHASTRIPKKNSTTQGANTKVFRKPKRAIVPPPRDQTQGKRARGYTDQLDNSGTTDVGTEFKVPPKRKRPSDQHARDQGRQKKLRSIRGSTDPLGRGHSTVGQ